MAAMAVTTSQVLRETKSSDALLETESSTIAMVATSSTRMERRSCSGLVKRGEARMDDELTKFRSQTQYAEDSEKIFKSLDKNNDIGKGEVPVIPSTEGLMKQSKRKAKKGLKDSLQDLKLSTLERKSDVKDLEHDDAISSQKAVNKYVSGKLKDNDAVDNAQQERIEELEQKLSSTRKSLLVITILSLLAFISGLLSIVL